MIDKKVALVVPTIRENCIKDFLDRWKPALVNNLTVFIMEDNPKKTFDLGVTKNIVHLCWEDIKEDLDDRQWIIPRRSDTVRSYAYWKVWSLKEFDYIMTLDDDCYPPTNEDGFVYRNGLASLIEEHINQIENKSKWFNTLGNVKPRGIPFYNTGNRNDVVVNHGLWTNVLDYDAPTQLVDPVPEQFAFDNRIVPFGSYFPLCGMNVMWKAEYTVLMYHLLMGQRVSLDLGSDNLVKLPFDRFGDIWCGIFMKKCLDMLEKTVSTGLPYIRHERASNPFTNLKKEANGLEVNEKLWKYVDDFYLLGFELEENYTPAALYLELGKHIREYDEFPEYKEYFTFLGNAMVIWASMFRKGKSE